MESSFFKLKPVRKQELQKALAAPPRPGLVLKKNKIGRNQWMKAHPDDEKKERKAKSEEETKQRKDPAFAGFEFFPGGVLGDLSLYSKGAEFASSDGGFYRIEKVADKVLTVALYTMQQGLKLVGGPANINVAAFQALLRKQHADQFNKEFNAGLRARLELESMLGQGATPQQRSRARKEVERWKKVNAGVQSAAKADIKPTAIDESQTIGQTTEGFDTAASGEKLSELQGKKGNTTEVFYPGKEGQPESVAGEYRLVEASDIIPSHDPTTFQANQNYPAGLQERAYHRDKAEQQKVRKNAENFKPGIVVNTNPDALNGPPVVNEQGVVLGGNSRTMSMQLLYKQGGEKAKELRAELLKKAESLGFDPADVKGMKEPVLVRRIEAQGEKQGLLVRQFNESMTQGMDESAQAAAIGRKLSKDNLDALANGIKDDQTLNDFLKSAASEDFVQSLAMSGVIDDRNRNQYVGKDKRLNKKGRELVELALLGKTIDDGDLLAATSDSMKTAIARIAPSLLSAEGAGEDHKMRNDLKLALSAINEMRSKLGKMPEKNSKAVENARLDLDMDFDRRARGEMQHPVNKNERASLLFDTLASKGTVQLSKIFRNYDRLATSGVGGGLFGAPSSVDLLKESIEGSEIQKALEAVFVEIIKGRTTKYLRRWRVTNKKTGKSSWRYAYPSKRGGKKRTRHEGHATEHKRVLGESSDKHYHPGASFAAGKGKGHFIIESVDGKNLTFYLDEDEHGNKGPVQTMSRADFRVLLREEHREEFEKAAMEGLIARQDLYQECLLGGVATERQIELAKAEMLRWHKENKAYLKSDDKKKLNAARGKLFAEATRQGLTKEDLYQMLGVTSLSDKAGQVTAEMLDSMRLRIEAGDFVKPGTKEPAAVEPEAVEAKVSDLGIPGVEPQQQEKVVEDNVSAAQEVDTEKIKEDLEDRLMDKHYTDDRKDWPAVTQEEKNMFGQLSVEQQNDLLDLVYGPHGGPLGHREFIEKQLVPKAQEQENKASAGSLNPEKAKAILQEQISKWWDGVKIKESKPGLFEVIPTMGAMWMRIPLGMIAVRPDGAIDSLSDGGRSEKKFAKLVSSLGAFESFDHPDIDKRQEVISNTAGWAEKAKQLRKLGVNSSKPSLSAEDQELLTAAQTIANAGDSRVYVSEYTQEALDKFASSAPGSEEYEIHKLELKALIEREKDKPEKKKPRAEGVSAEGYIRPRAVDLREGVPVQHFAPGQVPQKYKDEVAARGGAGAKTAEQIADSTDPQAQKNIAEYYNAEKMFEEIKPQLIAEGAGPDDLLRIYDDFIAGELAAITLSLERERVENRRRSVEREKISKKSNDEVKQDNMALMSQLQSTGLNLKEKNNLEDHFAELMQRVGISEFGVNQLISEAKDIGTEADLIRLRAGTRVYEELLARGPEHLASRSEPIVEEAKKTARDLQNKLFNISEPGAVEPGASKPAAVEPEASKPGAVKPEASKPGAVKPAAQEEGAKTGESSQQKMSVPPKKLGKKQARHDRKMFNDADGQIRSAPNGTADLRAIADRFSDAQISHAARELNKKLNDPLPLELFEKGNGHLDMFARTIKGTLPKKYHKGLGLAQFSMVHEEYVNQKAKVLSRMSAGLNPNGTITTSSLSSTDMLGRPLMGRAAEVRDYDERAMQEVFPEYLADVNDSFRSFDPASKPAATKKPGAVKPAAQEKKETIARARKIAIANIPKIPTYGFKKTYSIPDLHRDLYYQDIMITGNELKDLIFDLYQEGKVEFSPLTVEKFESDEEKPGDYDYMNAIYTDPKYPNKRGTDYYYINNIVPEDVKKALQVSLEKFVQKSVSKALGSPESRGLVLRKNKAGRNQWQRPMQAEASKSKAGAVEPEKKKVDQQKKKSSPEYLYRSAPKGEKGKRKYVYAGNAGKKVSRHSEEASVAREKILPVDHKFEAGEKYAVGKDQGHFEIVKVNNQQVTFKREGSDLDFEMHESDLREFVEQCFEGIFTDTKKPATEIEAVAVSAGTQASIKQSTGKVLMQFSQLATSPMRSLGSLLAKDPAKYSKIKSIAERNKVIFEDTKRWVSSVPQMALAATCFPTLYSGATEALSSGLVAAGADGTSGLVMGLAIGSTWLGVLACKAVNAAIKLASDQLYKTGLAGLTKLEEFGGQLRKAYGELAAQAAKFAKAFGDFTTEELDLCNTGTMNDVFSYYEKAFGV